MKKELRNSKKLKNSCLYPLNEIPKKIITDIARAFVYRICIGCKDILDEDWSAIFANAIGDAEFNSLVGIDYVVFEKSAWSVKTVKTADPFTCKNVRLISGCCSPDYSYGITDPHKDIQKTGQAVLNIWNDGLGLRLKYRHKPKLRVFQVALPLEKHRPIYCAAIRHRVFFGGKKLKFFSSKKIKERVNIAQDNYSFVRTAVLVRSGDLLSYSLYEEENHRFRTSDYEWKVNANGNLIGKNVETGETCFTWQPHGSQFTIHEKLPESAIKFKIKKPSIVEKSAILKSLAFDETWVQIL